MKIENIVNEISKCYLHPVVLHVVSMMKLFSWDLIDIYLEQAIVGRVIRALQKCFHPDCFRCHLCHVSLVEMGFSKYNGRFVFEIDILLEDEDV